MHWYLRLRNNAPWFLCQCSWFLFVIKMKTDVRGRGVPELELEPQHRRTRLLHWHLEKKWFKYFFFKSFLLAAQNLCQQSAATGGSKEAGACCQMSMANITTWMDLNPGTLLHTQKTAATERQDVDVCVSLLVHMWLIQTMDLLIQKNTKKYS